jgi:hypothetical protein
MPNIPSTSWNESSPAGSDLMSTIDNRARELKTQIREVVGVDHDFPSSGQATDNGQHLRVTLQEQADLGSGAVGTTILGSQTINNIGELVYTTEDDEDIQITKADKIKLSSGRLENNVSLSSRNAADSGDVSLIKANASNQAEITPALLPAAGIVLPEISAPTTIANQGALYTKNDGDQTELYFREESNGDEVQITNAGALNVPAQVGFGSWVDKSSSYAAQAAATDGFVTVNASVGGSSTITISIYTDSGSNPSTVRGAIEIDGDSTPGKGMLFCPVKKGEYWKVVPSSTASLTINVYWIPLGS